MLKKILVVMIVLAAVASVQANALWNGSFDVNSANPDGWWTYLADSENQSVTIEVGTLSAYAAHISNASESSSQLGQSVSASAGNVIVVSGAYRSTYWGGAGITIQYVDSEWGYLDYAYAQICSGDGEDSGWLTFSFSTGDGEGTWTAPEGTAYITLKIEEWGWAEISYDEMSVEIVPEPATMIMIGLGGLTLVRRKRA